METAVEINKLTKIYKQSGLWGLRKSREPVTAVKDVTLTINSGEMFGLLGPNGAGKTTLVKMLCTLVIPSSGTASVAGHALADEHAIRSVTGLVVSDERSFFWRLSAARNLEFFASLYGLNGQKARDRIGSVLRDVDLQDRADHVFSSLSSGMRQRLAIARALLHEPQILFLDEPTRSLDPIATQRLHALIRRLLDQRDMTVFLITHDLSEAEKLCRHVALMHEARIRAVGRLEDLRRQLSPKKQYRIACILPDPSNLKQLQEELPSLAYTPPGGADKIGQLRFEADDKDGELSQILDFMHRQDIKIIDIGSAPVNLEEVFAHFTAGNHES